MSEIVDVIKQYYQFRGLEKPDEAQAFQFLVSEVGELADALVSSNGKWVRNNPDRERNIADEAGDVLMMLCVTLMDRGIDPFEAMLAKFIRKGFVYERKTKTRAECDYHHPDNSALRRPYYAFVARPGILPAGLFDHGRVRGRRAPAL
jgi:NTP pyrophosphatase (non-canonical NTP hydrolase)